MRKYAGLSKLMNACIAFVLTFGAYAASNLCWAWAYDFEVPEALRKD